MLKNDIHIGSVIREVFLERRREKRMTIAQLAGATGCNRTRIYAVFHNKSIDTDLLVRISKTLEHNFFLEYFDASKPRRLHLALIETDELKIADMEADSALNIVKIYPDV